MTAPELLVLFDSVYLLALASWVGSVLFFAFGVAGGAEDREWGRGGRIRAILPRFYLWGAISAALALPALLGGPLSFPEYRGPWVAVRALAVVAGALLMLYGGNSLAPALDAADAARLPRLRRRAMLLNAAIVAIGAGLLVGYAGRPAPRTSGIVEMTPQQRAQYGRSIGEVIEQLEAEQGLRPPKPAGGRVTPGADGQAPPIDEATIEELGEIFERRRVREDRSRGAGSRPARDSRAKP